MDIVHGYRDDHVAEQTAFMAAEVSGPGKHKSFLLVKAEHYPSLRAHLLQHWRK